MSILRRIKDKIVALEEKRGLLLKKADWYRCGEYRETVRELNDLYARRYQLQKRKPEPYIRKGRIKTNAIEPRDEWLKEH